MVVERNSSCPCGSGKKYKKCCLANDEAATAAHLAEAAARQAEEQRLAAAAKEEANQQQAQERLARLKTRETPPVPDVAAELDPEEPEDDGVGADWLTDDERIWPPPSAADQQLVNAWWQEVNLVYLKPQCGMQAAWLLERTVAFLNDQPHLFRHLYLHDSFLYDLETEAHQAGCGNDFQTLLLRLRGEQPEVYFEGFGFWDLSLLADALQAGRNEDVPACLTLFREEPLKFLDQFLEVVGLLAWHDCEADLRELLEPTARVIAESRLLIGDGGGAQLTYLAMIPALEAGADSPIPLQTLCQEVIAIGLLKDDAETWEWLRHTVLMASPMAAAAPLDLRQPHGKRFNNDVFWNFIGWMHRTKGFGWTKARFLAVPLLSYWEWAEKKRKGGNKLAKKEPARFGLKTDRLREYLWDRCRDFFGIRTMQALPTIQAFHYFTEFLVARGLLGEDEAGKSQAEAAAAFAAIRKVAAPRAPAIHICPTYAALITGRDLRVVATSQLAQ